MNDYVILFRLTLIEKNPDGFGLKFSDLLGSCKVKSDLNHRDIKKYPDLEILCANNARLSLPISKNKEIFSCEINGIILEE